MADAPFSKTRRELFSSLNPRGTGDTLATLGSQRTSVPPDAGVTVRLSSRAMACDFSVIMNPGGTEQIEAAGAVLESVHAVEEWLSIYRESSELSRVNRIAASGPVRVRGDLFDLLQKAREIHDLTDGALDMAAGSLTQLWRTCRRNQRIPDQVEVGVALLNSGLL